MKSTAIVLRRVLVVATAAILLLPACRTRPQEVAPGAGETSAEAARELEVESAQQEVGPTRIILFIGDGMGLGSVAAAAYAQGRPLAMMKMPHFGLMTTHGHEFVTTDSAAAATALATGRKTHFEGISVEPGTTPEQEEDPRHQLPTVIGAASSSGWRTGLISTTRINHATPGAFAAHRHNRQQYDEIADDMRGYEVDVLMGGGADFFQELIEGQDRFEEMGQHGYTIARTRSELEEALPSAQRLVALTHPRDMPYADTGDREVELAEMVKAAIEVLDRDNPDGFFLMVEGSLIDWAGHDMNGERVVSETLDFDRALQQALEYARGRSDTLVLVTADHETGALDIVDARTAEGYLEHLGGVEAARSEPISAALEVEGGGEMVPPFAHIALGDAARFGPPEVREPTLTASFGFFSAASRRRSENGRRFSAMHSPALVPIFAQGVGAEEVVQTRDNAELGGLLQTWITQTPSARHSPSQYLQQAQPENIILILAEGFGVGALSAAYYHYGQLKTLDMPHHALMATHNLDSLVADPAASATAIATGHRTRKGALGMAPSALGEELRSVPNVLEIAGRNGKNTGLITTGSLANPTAAAFLVHQPDLANFGPEERAEIEGRPSQNPGSPMLWGSPSHEQSEERALSRRLENALLELSGEEEGFLLVVDAVGLGERLRALEQGRPLLQEIQEIDDAVAAALAFAEANQQTLVLVTSPADHTLSVMDNHYGFHSGRCGIAVECGGDYQVPWLSVGLDEFDLQMGSKPPKIAVQYTWMVQAAHRSGFQAGGTPSANFVPLFAQGPAAATFRGFWEQPRLGQWLVDWAASSPQDSP